MYDIIMKLVSPYRNIKQYTRISIDPYHMNSDIKNNMKIILKKKQKKNVIKMDLQMKFIEFQNIQMV